PHKLIDLLKSRTPTKLPSYEWQESALKIIKELNVPNFKRSAVFKVCRDKHKQLVEQCLNDTKELCQTGEKWKYFFKIVGK
ncbi:hypothetical protein KJ978_02625, partial [Patescibacteria group bacterium]|nr:hypothetical protein [Patescibacteria group bacterium]